MTTQELRLPAAAPAPPTRAGRRPPRARRPMPAGPWLWWGPLLVTALGGIVRFWKLGRPDAIVFDETYYVKDAWSLLKFGHERAYVDGADSRLIGGQTDIFTDEPTFVVHPPVGKWIIAAGEGLAGLDPVGWRLGVAVVGTAMIFLLARVAIRLTRSVVLGCLAGLLLALDGLAVVMSRTALLDGILAFFLLAAFGCLLVDRDATRDRLLAGAAGGGLRPWRLAAGVCLGLALGTKWSALPFIAAFGVMAVLWDAGARRAAGQDRPRWRALRRDAAPAFGALVLLPLAGYVTSWSGWLSSSGGWSRQWAAENPGGLPFVPDALRSLWHYHMEIERFHTNLTEDHPYRSSPWGWTVLARPVAYHSDDYSRGEAGCTAQECVAEVLGIGTPALWWAASAALAYLVWRAFGARDWRAGAVLVGVAAGWLPWFVYDDRPIFYFYTIAFLPYLILGLVLALGALIGPDLGTGATQAQRRRRAVGATATGLLVVLVVLNFFYLYPLLTAETLPRAEWLERMWFRTWI